MGRSGKLDNTKQKTSSPQDIIDYLDDLFAYALSIGMTYEQYWLQNPKLIKSYIKAQEYKASRKAPTAAAIVANGKTFDF